MSRPHRNTHRDGNQAEIVAALRDLGYIVWDISPQPGLCDLLVYGYCGESGNDEWRAIEVKTATGTVEPEQRAMIEAGMVTLARDVTDVLRAFGRVA